MAASEFEAAIDCGEYLNRIASNLSFAEFQIKRPHKGAFFIFLAVERVLGEPCSAELLAIFPVPREICREY